jgi:hypothetical protein
MPLEREMKTYREKLPELLDQEGRFVLIREDDLAGTFDTYADAIQAGYERFGLKQFLVKQIAATEPVYFIPPVQCRI